MSVDDAMLGWALGVVDKDGVERRLHVADKLDALKDIVDDPKSEVNRALVRACRQKYKRLPASAFLGAVPDSVILDVEAAPLAKPMEPASTAFVDWGAFWQADADEAEWAYPDVLARGRGHAIYARQKEGKSLFTLWLAFQLATGDEPVVVMYLDFEMSEADVRERLEDMGAGPETDLSRLRYALLPMLPPLDTSAGSAALCELVDGAQAEHPNNHVVVILDTMSRAVDGDENSADTFRDFFRHTGSELKRRGVTWVRLDHAGKDADRGQRGSSSKGDDVDVIWKLTRTQHGVCLHRDAARMAWVPEKVVFRLHEDPLRYVRLTDDYPAGTSGVAQLLDELEVPLDAPARTAQGALRKAGQGRRTTLVSAALRWRRDKANEHVHPFTSVSQIAGNTPSDDASETVRETHGDDSDLRLETPRETRETCSPGRLGNVSPPIGGNVPEPPSENGDWHPEEDEELAL